MVFDIFAIELWPYWSAFAVLVTLMAIELGSGAFSALEGSLGIDPHFDVGVDGGKDLYFGWFSFLHFLGFGHVPAVIVISCYLAAFCLSGFALNSAVFSLTDGNYLPPLAGALTATAPSIAIGKTLVELLKPLSRDRSENVELVDFVGKRAMITSSASAGAQVEAKIIDEFGNSHFEQVVVDAACSVGEEVTLQSYDPETKLFNAVVQQLVKERL